MRHIKRTRLDAKPETKYSTRKMAVSTAGAAPQADPFPTYASLTRSSSCRRRKSALRHRQALLPPALRRSSPLSGNRSARLGGALPAAANFLAFGRACQQATRLNREHGADLAIWRAAATTAAVAT